MYSPYFISSARKCFFIELDLLRVDLLEDKSIKYQTQLTGI